MSWTGYYGPGNETNGSYTYTSDIDADTWRVVRERRLVAREKWALNYVYGVRWADLTHVFTIDYDGGDVELSTRGTALRAELCQAGIPAYPSLRRAAWSLARLHAHHLHRGTSA